MHYPKFTYRDFIKKHDSDKLIKWLDNKGANCIGAGASRYVYRISPTRVIKVEYDKYFGYSQNKEEVQKYNQHKNSNLITQCYWYHPKYVWIISQFAEKVPLKKTYAWNKWCDKWAKKIEKELDISDLAIDNSGIINGNFVIVDYGLPCLECA